MPRPDTVSDTAPTEPTGRIPLDAIQRLLRLPPEKTMRLTSRDAELFAQLTASRLKIRETNSNWTDRQVDEELKRRFGVK